MMCLTFQMRFLVLIGGLLILYAKAAPSVSKNPKKIDNAEAMADYLLKYSTDFFGTGIGQAGVATDEDALLDVDLEDNPLFTDFVFNFQQMAGLEATGAVNDETIEKLGESRCGVTDPISDPNAPGKYEVQSKWNSKKHKGSGLYYITYSFPKRDTPQHLKFQSFKKGVTLAMCSWELISNVRFKNLGLGKSTADVLISYEKGDHKDGYSFDGKGGTLGHAFYPEDGRLHLDREESWYLANEKKGEDRTKKDVYTAVLHELGHTIGLLHSKDANAVMAPFYRFRGSFDTFEMPMDEGNGVVDMYGDRIESDPSTEAASACREARDKYGYHPKPHKTSSAMKFAILEEFDEQTCEDEPAHAPKNCGLWQARGYCDMKMFAPTMHKRCKKTCGFCPGPVPATKHPEKVLTPSSLASSICDIPEFDSMVTTFDGENGFAAFTFKDDYFFKTEISLSPAKYATHNLFNKTDYLKGAFKWDTDPKSILPGLFKIKNANFMHKTSKVHASLVSGRRYYAFEGENVHTYGRDMGVLSFERTYETAKLFRDYPNLKVDAAHVSIDPLTDARTFTLFYGRKMWQYKESINSDKGNLLFSEIENRTGVDIGEWNGVPACDLDAVFEYRGVPYFLKGNIFWPAVDTEPQVPRDITYNFFRCWQTEPEDLVIPTSCNVKEEDPGNGAELSQMKSTYSVFLLTIFNYLFFKLFV